MYRARDVFKVTDALVVTQEFHLPRAVYIARTLGLDATGVPADIQPYTGEWRFALREWPARVKAFFQLHVTKPGPRFLGPAIPIDGDGRLPGAEGRARRRPRGTRPPRPSILPPVPKHITTLTFDLWNTLYAASGGMGDVARTRPARAPRRDPRLPGRPTPPTTSCTRPIAPVSTPT